METKKTTNKTVTYKIGPNTHLGHIVVLDVDEHEMSDTLCIALKPKAGNEMDRKTTMLTPEESHALGSALISAAIDAGYVVIRGVEMNGK